VVSLPVTDRAERPAEEAVPPALPRHARILVVDDEPDLCLLLQEALGADGHRVETASSGREAIGRLEHGSFDLIVSDLRMPDLDGPSLHGYLLRHRRDMADRLVFITGDVLGGEHAGPAVPGGVPLIEKPIEIDEMRRRVASLLSRRPGPGAASAEEQEP